LACDMRLCGNTARPRCYPASIAILASLQAAAGFAHVPNSPPDKSFSLFSKRAGIHPFGGASSRWRDGATRGPSMMLDPNLAFGMVAGSISSAALLPVDLVKTATVMHRGSVAQGSASGSISSGSTSKASSGDLCVASFLRDVVRNDGPAGLFKGFKAAVLGGGPEAGIQFAVRDSVMAALTAAWLSKAAVWSLAAPPLMGTVLLALGPEAAEPLVAPAVAAGGVEAALATIASSGGHEMQAVAGAAEGATLLSSAGVLPAPPDVAMNAVAGCAAGFTQVVATCPMEVLKQREMCGEEALSPLELGLGGLFKGAGATWLREIPFSGIYFAGVAYFSGQCEGMGMNDAVSTLVAGLLAGSVAALLTTPADVVKTKVQCGADGETVGGVARRILREEGPGGFLAGVEARVSKVGPSMMINLAVYESLKLLYSSLH